MEALFFRHALVFLKEAQKAAFTPTCSTKQILTEAQKSKDFEEAPFYSLILQHMSFSSKNYWRWLVGCKGCDSIVVMAGSCKLK